MPSHDPGVLVIGAGPTGLTVACALLLHGVSVRVVDRAAGPAQTSRANILHARGAEVLDRIGAVGNLADRAVSAMLVTMHVGGEPVTTMRFGDPGLGTSRPALVVSQAEIEAELRRRLTELGGAVEWATPLTAASQDADAEHFLLADVHADWDRDRSGTAGWYHRDGLFLAMPMREAGDADDRWRMMANVILTDGEHLSDDDIVDRFRQLLTERVGHPNVRIKDAVWTSVFRVQRRLADEYRRGRILLAGDAAHIHSPMGGQGMNTGIGDAENLAWKLALVVDGVASSDLLDTYQRERRPLAADVLRGTTAATRLQVGDGVAARFLRNRILVPLANRPAVQRRLTRAASQLWVTYANGPMHRLRRRPRPGDRVPDIPCRTTTSASSTLHAQTGGRWALLVTDTDDRVGPVVRKRLGGRVITLTSAEPRPGTAWLVRPDAHLAWRGRTDDDSVDRWLARAFGSRP